jgi:hypothetical protein
MAMDPELRSVMVRYSIVGVVLAGSVIWTVAYVKDVTHENGAPIVLGADAGPERPFAEKGPVAPSVDKAPSLSEMFIGDRVACGPACRLEAYCGLRAVDDCLRTSCDGNVRKPAVAGDAAFAKADDCRAAAAAPCADACARLGACHKDHGDDEKCALQCKDNPDYRKERCVLEADTCDAALSCK